MTVSAFRRALLLHAPTLVSSHSLLLCPAALAWAMAWPSWAWFSRVSLSSVPDIDAFFSGALLVSLGLVAVWLGLSRTFGVIARYGQRNPFLELVDLLVMIVCVGVIVFSPFVAAQVLTVRVSQLVTVNQLLLDIDDLRRGHQYAVFGDTGLDYWRRARTGTSNSFASADREVIPGLTPQRELGTQASENLRASNRSAIGADVEGMLSVYGRYSQSWCSKKDGQPLVVVDVVSDILRVDALSMNEPGQKSERDDILKRYRCYSATADVSRTVERLLAVHEIDERLPSRHRRPFVFHYALGAVVYPVCFVFMLGELTKKYLMWLIYCSLGPVLLTMILMRDFRSELSWMVSVLVGSCLFLSWGLFVSHAYTKRGEVLSWHMLFMTGFLQITFCGVCSVVLNTFSTSGLSNGRYENIFGWLAFAAEVAAYVAPLHLATVVFARNQFIKARSAPRSPS
jgi:hypothetical protein